MKKIFLQIVLPAAVSLLTLSAHAQDTVIIIRHGEKPATGDNLSCKGLNRALGIPGSLSRRYSIPLYTYVPAINKGKESTHARMFETVTPMAVKYNLTLNTKHDESATAEVAKAVKGKLGSKRKHGTILLVWEHNGIPKIATALGVEGPPKWDGDDFDSIWIITKIGGGKATLTLANEGLNGVNSTCQ